MIIKPTLEYLTKEYTGLVDAFVETQQVLIKMRDEAEMHNYEVSRETQELAWDVLRKHSSQAMSSLLLSSIIKAGAE
tara:strand:+ start:944 stop:1174 length:231 start_codon:yes stop_codon:yes gene_type:complete